MSERLLSGQCELVSGRRSYPLPYPTCTHIANGAVALTPPVDEMIIQRLPQGM